MKDIRFSKTGEKTDGSPLYDLYINGELRGKGIALGEVVRLILAFEEETVGTAEKKEASA